MKKGILKKREKESTLTSDIRHQTSDFSLRSEVCSLRSDKGVILVVTLLVMVVLSLLGATFLTLATTESKIAFNEREARQAFYAAEAGVQEALIRMNLDPSSVTDEVDTTYDGNPDSVRDPQMVNNLTPVANPRDSAFWHYNPSWSYGGQDKDDDGNYKGANDSQKSNLNQSGRSFIYNGSSSRALPSGSSYTVSVVPMVRKITGQWKFVDQYGNAAADNYYYYRITSTGTAGNAQKTVKVIVKKYWFKSTIPAALATEGDVKVGGNASVDDGNEATRDENPTGTAIQSASTITITGSATIDGNQVQNTLFPGFQKVFGITKDEMKAMASQSPNEIYNPTGDVTNPFPSQRDTNTPTRIIWISNPLVKTTFTSGHVIGSSTNPVIMVVEGDLTFNSVTVYGTIYVMKAFRNQGKSHLEGAVLVEGTTETDILGTGEGSKLIYSQAIIDRMNKSPVLFPFSPVKGTWREG